MSSTESIILIPRPYSKSSGKLLLLPLLPLQKKLRPLPREVWVEVFKFGAADPDGGYKLLWTLLTVCKEFEKIAMPLLYSYVEVTKMSTLEKLYNRLHAAEQKWDSIRRIPYSAPGRWINTLDISQTVFTGHAQALLLDSILTHIFPLLPFLSHFYMNPSFILSRRALKALAHRDGALSIRSLVGISYIPAPLSTEEEPIVQLVRACVNLEELEVIDQGPDPTELEFSFDEAGINLPTSFKPISLPHLRILTLLSMHSSPLMLSLILSSLPALKKLTVTPYDDIPYPASYTSTFIATHGQTLRSLLIVTPKSWPTRLHPSPTTLLKTSPFLRHLSLECPLPELELTELHPLTILSIPRPTPEAWRLLERLFPLLPHLSVVRARDVRWLRKGMPMKAREAGLQGEMREWRRRLVRRHIMILDSDWNQSE